MNYIEAARTKDATFRVTLTDYRGRVTERGAANRTAWLALVNRSVDATQPDPRNRDGRTSTERRAPKYLHIESICILPSGERVPVGCVSQHQAKGN